METKLETYYDFAENDYNFFKAAYKNGLIGNSMGAMAQEICEKYMKHIVDTYITVDSIVANAEKKEALKTHNLNKLYKYINQHIKDIELDRNAINTVNGLYFTTRYPGDDSFVVDENDLKCYVEAVDMCKEAIDRYIYDKEKSLDKENKVLDKKTKKQASR